MADAKLKPVQLAARLRSVRPEVLADPKTKELVFTSGADGAAGPITLKDGKDAKDAIATANVDYCWGKDATTDSIFQGCVAPLLDQVLEGYNATITLFGARESGKGYTMSDVGSTSTAPAKLERKDEKKDSKGEDDSDAREAQALMETKVYAKLNKNTFAAQSADHLFSVIKQRAATHKYLVTVSVFQVATGAKELGNQRVTDMLNPRTSSGSGGGAEPDGGLRVVDHRAYGSYVEPLAELEATSAEEMKEYLTQAVRVSELLRARNTVAKNKPHTFYDIRVESKSVADALGSVRSARLRFVELAGMGLIRFDSGLQTFKAVLDLIGTPENVAATPLHKVPYGDSIVTRLLEHALGGNSYLLFFSFFDPLLATPNKELNAAAAAVQANRQIESHRAVFDVINRARNIRNNPKRNQSNIEQIKQQLRAEIKSVRAKCSLGQPSAYKANDVNPDYLRQWQSLTDELNRIKTQTWEARRKRSNDALLERQQSLSSGTLLTIGTAVAVAGGGGAPGSVPPAAGAAAGAPGAEGGAANVSLFESVAAMTGKGRVAGMELILTQELATDASAPYQMRLTAARGAADSIIRAMIGVEKIEARLRKQRDIREKAIRLHGPNHDDVKSRSELIHRFEVELERNQSYLRRDRPIFESAMTAALSMELKQKKSVNPPHEASRLQEVKDLQTFKQELSTHPVTDQTTVDSIQATANETNKEATTSFNRAFEKAIGPAAVAALAAAQPAQAGQPPQALPPGAPAPEWMAVKNEAIAQFQFLAKEYAKCEWEKRKYMARLMERDFRHYFHLHTFQQHMMHVFRKYRLHFEAQKVALETRYRTLLESSVKDALDLHAENVQLKSQIAELQKNSRQGL